MNRDDLGTRMKAYYEEVPKTRLTRRTPVIIRIDGKAFHTFTKHFKKPFDDVLMIAMRKTMARLCRSIQGVRLGYCQSDEISLLLCDYDKLDSSAWFDYEVQKICSVAASMATLFFNQEFTKEVESYTCWHDQCQDEAGYITRLYGAMHTGAMFDARCFNVPKEEVTNYFYWRQLDAARNSVQMVGQAYFKHSELQNKSCNEIQDMLYDTYKINWNDFPVYKKRGTCCIKVNDEWTIDNNIPMWKGEDRNYIEDIVKRGEV